MAVIDLGKALESVRTGVADPSLQELPRHLQPIILALYVKQSEDLDSDGYYQGRVSLRRLAAKWFGLGESALNALMSDLVKGGLFGHNDKGGSHRRYRVLEGEKINEIMGQYSAYIFMAETQEPSDASGDSNVEATIKGGQEHIVDALKKAENDELKANDDHVADEPQGMSLAHLQHRVADHEVRRICAEMENDPKLIRLIAEGLYTRLHHLNNQ